jgi:pimeloyl-ACP methyl ester carboxylesterase
VRGRESIYRSVAGRDEIRRWCVGELDRWNLPVQRSVVSSNGVDTHVVAAGAGAVTAVFLPGTNFPAAACGPIVEALAARCRVVAPDLPGQPGLSSEIRPPARARLDWYGDWLDGLLRDATEGPVTVIGWSMGAAVALSCSSQLINRVVLVSPGGLIRLSTPPAVLAASIRWIAGRREVDSARLLRVMHGEDREPRSALVEWMTLVSRHVRSSADPGVARIATTRRAHAAIGGERDRFLPPDRLQPVLQDRLGVDLVTVAGAGHLLVEERPDAVAAFAVPRA